MTIDLKLIEAFVLIARSGTMSGAESVSGVPKATLSRQMLKLEEELGIQLLQRTPRRVIATEAGLAFYKRCESILSDFSTGLEAARTEIHDLSIGLSGKLSVLTDSEFSTTFACHVTSLFLDRYPNVQCELEIARKINLQEMEVVDCYICSTPPAIPDMIGKLLGRISYGLYASPGYLSDKGEPQLPRDLSEHHAIVLKGASTSREKTVLHAPDATHPYHVRSSILTNDYWVMKAFCVNGHGIALLPDFFAKPEVSGGFLVPVLAAWKPEMKKVYCAYQRQRYMGTKLRSFVDLMASCIDNLASYSAYVASNGTTRSGFEGDKISQFQ